MCSRACYRCNLAERVTQAQIGALYVGASFVVAISATAPGGRPPRPLVIGAFVLSVAGIALAGIATEVPLWVLPLLLAALGIGLGNTGSLGLLVEAVPVERIVTAIVIWSQVGIIGYLLGPLTGGSWPRARAMGTFGSSRPRRRFLCSRCLAGRSRAHERHPAE